MNYGLYLSATGALANMHRQDVLANNLANLNTVGFKPDQVTFRERQPERLEGPEPFVDPQWMLERLGGGLFVAPTRVRLGQGALNETGNTLDAAIEGDGFFAVGGSRPGGPEHLTRDGRFTLDARGRLVMASNGMTVLDQQRRPITLERDQPVQIDAAGAVIQNGRTVAQLRLVSADAGDLVKEGRDLMRVTGRARPREVFTGRVRQGYTEASTVDPIMTMNDMMNAAKAAQGNLKLMQFHDQILGQTFNTFARVA